MSERNMKVVRGMGDRDREHAFAQEHLPWQAAGTLDPVLERRMQAHLEDCSECREALEREHAIAEAIRATPMVDVAPQAGLVKVLARIEQRNARRAWLARWLHPLMGVGEHRPLALAVAAQALVIVMLAGALMISLGQRRPAADYRTLSNPVPAPTIDGAMLRVVLDEQLTVAQVHAMLAPLAGRIVSGPGRNGLFTLQVPGDAQAAVNALRAQPGVRLAEIVTE